MSNINTHVYPLSNQNKPDFEMKNQFTTNEESSLSLTFINTKQNIFFFIFRYHEQNFGAKTKYQQSENISTYFILKIPQQKV